MQKYRRLKNGFTLIELMVALAASAILSLSVLQFYGYCHRLSFALLRDYQKERSELLMQMKNAMPYCTPAKVRGRHGFWSE
ncbi:MAG: prepilin-type N-terminal cleavage/methylation domain-containing protein [Fibrobacter sp.]|nr:prepilin-type N-terminal cleavage/methylation domain-containing protein [Fibrobacter sp.]